MKQQPKIRRHALKVFDEKGNEWATYEGNNDLKPRTATILPIEPGETEKVDHGHQRASCG